MSEIKLKPCPFCGGKAKLRNYVNSYAPHSSAAYVQCEKCKCATYHFTDTKGDFGYMSFAIEAWNRRADNG